MLPHGRRPGLVEVEGHLPGGSFVWRVEGLGLSRVSGVQKVQTRSLLRLVTWWHFFLAKLFPTHLPKRSTPKALTPKHPSSLFHLPVVC